MMLDKKGYILLYLKGLSMGAADIVPGVSGGTIAFVTGIYDELIDSIKSIGPGSLKILIQQGPFAFWQAINGTFLSVLLLGIGTSILGLSQVITHWLENYPTLLWSFFFGLIVVSSVHMARQIKQWNRVNQLALIMGAVSAYLITSVSPAELDVTPLMLVLSGSLAICAMILPGISGSFILLLLGMYGHVIGAIKALDMSVLVLFAGGCVIGILGFSRVLSWLLARYHEMTVALLTGFMLGALNKVWPWKQTLTWRINSHGHQVPLTQDNILPSHFFEVTGQDPHTIICISLMVFAIVFVLGLEWVACRSRRA